MKKIFLLLLSVAVLFVIGCGSGGGGSTTASTTSPGGGQTGTFNLTIHQAALAASGNMKHSLATLPANYARVVVRKIESVPTTVLVCSTGQFNGDGDCIDPTTGNVIALTPEPGPPALTEVYKNVQDAQIVGGAVGIVIPIGNGYTIDVLTYDHTTTPYTMASFGRLSPVNITASGGSGTVTVYDILNQVTVATTPASVIAGQQYALQISSVVTDNTLPTVGLTIPIRQNYHVSLDVPTIPASPFSSTGFTAQTSTNAIGTNNTSLNITVTLYISDDMLDLSKSTDVYTAFTRTDLTSVPFASLVNVNVPIQ